MPVEEIDERMARTSTAVCEVIAESDGCCVLRSHASDGRPEDDDVPGGPVLPDTLWGYSDDEEAVRLEVDVLVKLV